MIKWIKSLFKNTKPEKIHIRFDANGKIFSVTIPPTLTGFQAQQIECYKIKINGLPHQGLGRLY